MVEFVDDKRVEYDSRFSICGDGHVLQTIKYKTANNGSVDFNVLHDGGQSLESVYKSPILDINIQIGSEMMVTIWVVRIPIVNTCLVKTSMRIGGNKTDLKIMELSICMNFITLALETSCVILQRNHQTIWFGKLFC